MFEECPGVKLKHWFLYIVTWGIVRFLNMEFAGISFVLLHMQTQALFLALHSLSPPVWEASGPTEPTSARVFVMQEFVCSWLKGSLLS